VVPVCGWVAVTWMCCCICDAAAAAAYESFLIVRSVLRPDVWVLMIGLLRTCWSRSEAEKRERAQLGTGAPYQRTIP